MATISASTPASLTTRATLVHKRSAGVSPLPVLGMIIFCFSHEILHVTSLWMKSLHMHGLNSFQACQPWHLREK